MCLKFHFFAILLVLCLPLRAQFAVDTLGARALPQSEFNGSQPAVSGTSVVSGLAGCQSKTGFSWSQLAAPGVLIGSGLAVHYLAHETVDYGIRSWVCGKRGVELDYDTGEAGEICFEDKFQYVPLAMDLGLGLAGVRANHSFSDRAIESAIAHVACGAISWTSKRLFNTLRPNERNTQSFPSGHTDFVFLNAELVRMEYGPWIGSVAYAMATATGVMRVYHNWHWFSDILAGAGLGILTAHIGGWLLEPVKDLLNVPTWEWDGFNNRRKSQLAFFPAADPWNGVYNLTFAVSF